MKHYLRNLRSLNTIRINGVTVDKFRSSHPDVLLKKVLLKTSQNSQKNTCASVSFSIKLQASGFCELLELENWRKTMHSVLPREILESRDLFRTLVNI